MPSRRMSLAGGGSSSEERAAKLAAKEAERKAKEADKAIKKKKKEEKKVSKKKKGAKDAAPADDSPRASKRLSASDGNNVLGEMDPWSESEFLVEVLCPPGKVPGDVFTIPTADHGDLEVEVPEGVDMGDEFTVDIREQVTAAKAKALAAEYEGEQQQSNTDAAANVRATAFGSLPW